VAEVQRILGCVRKPRYRVCSEHDLRLRSAAERRCITLQVADIDGERMLLYVRQGKGAKHRYVPLPAATLEMLRTLLDASSPSHLALSRSPK
jgi:integrase